jgi:hypothetical protein
MKFSHPTRVIYLISSRFINTLSLSLLSRKKRSKNSDVIQGRVMFVRLGNSLYIKIEFVSYVVVVMLVQCIKCEAFFFILYSFFLFDCALFRSFARLSYNEKGISVYLYQSIKREKKNECP